jgi:hypothetical protein
LTKHIGRPPRAGHAARSNLNIRLTNEERDAMKALAVERGITMSDLIRSSLVAQERVIIGIDVAGAVAEMLGFLQKHAGLKDVTIETAATSIGVERDALERAMLGQEVDLRDAYRIVRQVLLSEKQRAIFRAA